MTTLKQFEVLQVSPNTFMSMSPFRLIPNCSVLLCPARPTGHSVVIRLYNQSNTVCDLQTVFLISGEKFSDLEANIVKTIKGFPAWLAQNVPDQLVANIGLVKVCHYLNDRSVNLGVAREVPNYKAAQLNGLNGEATNTDDIDAVNFTPAFALHGRYVGPGHTGALRLNQAYWQAPPIDELDAAARDHDWHYFMHPKNRAEADELLSRRAFAAIRNLPSWTAKAKALAVGLGMKLMSKIGSRNGERLTFPPPIRRGRMRPSINGNNGEATNSDDVKGARKGVRNEKKQEKKAMKSMVKAMNKPVALIGRARAPVVQGLMPTSMQTTYDIRPYYKTGKVGKYSREVKTLFSVGYAGGTGPVGANSTYLAGGVILSLALDKALFAGQNIAQDFENYERWKIKSARYHVLPSVASNTPGSIWGLPDPDAIDVLPLGNTISPTVLNGHRNAVKHTLWAGQMTGNLVFNRAKLFTDMELVAFSSLNGNVNSQTAAENRFYAAGVFSLLNGEGIPTTLTTSFCEVFLEFDIEFSEPQNSDLGSLVMSVKAATLGGSSMPGFSSGTGNDVGASIIQNFGTIGNLTCEYVYNPKAYFPVSSNASYYMLPVGTYLYTFGCDLLTIPTSVTADLNVTINGGISTHVRFAAFDQNGFGGIEFTAAPANQASGLSRLSGWFIIRISQVVVGNRAKLSLFPTATFTGSGVLVSWHSQMLRLPEFSANPLAMYFPIGNNGQGALFDKRKRFDLSVSNGMHNPKCAGVKGVLEEDVGYYEAKLRKKFPDLNWSFEEESSDTRIVEWELPRDKWPKSDSVKFREEEKVREAETHKAIDADCKRDEMVYFDLCNQAERTLGPNWNKKGAKMYGPHWSLGWFKCVCGDEFPWDSERFRSAHADIKGNHYHCMMDDPKVPPRDEQEVKVDLARMKDEADKEVKKINDMAKVLGYTKDGAALLEDALRSESDTPEMVENPLSKSVHLDPSFADTLLKAIQGKK